MGRCCRKSPRFGGHWLDSTVSEWPGLAVRSSDVVDFLTLQMRPGMQRVATQRQGLEVLCDCGEMEFVTCAGKPSEPHAFEAVVNLQVSKTHLDALSFVP